MSAKRVISRYFYGILFPEIKLSSEARAFERYGAERNINYRATLRHHTSSEGKTDIFESLKLKP